LIANEDRHQNQYLITEDWRMILIDHSRSFRSSPKYTENLMYGTEGIKEKKLIRMLPRFFIAKIRSLDYDAVKGAVGPYLTEKEIESILKRKVLLLAEIEKMIKEVGESKFLY
jgi:hypothetical protein